MNVSCKLAINANKEAIWNIITDIDNAAERITEILELEVLERPESGLIGLKWKEKRKVFGKEATETMWITDAEENSFYRTRAENCGAVYISEMRILEEGGQNYLQMSFSGEISGFFGKLMSKVMGVFMMGSMRKLIMQDLEDIKKAVEGV